MGRWTAESDGPAATYSWSPPRILRWWNGARGAPGPSAPVVVLLDADVKVLSDLAVEAARRLTPALVAAIRQVWSVWADIGVTKPWIGLCGDRVAIACAQQRPADAIQVAALVEIGSALAAARG